MGYRISLFPVGITTEEKQSEKRRTKRKKDENSGRSVAEKSWSLGASIRVHVVVHSHSKSAKCKPAQRQKKPPQLGKKEAKELVNSWGHLLSLPELASSRLTNAVRRRGKAGGILALDGLSIAGGPGAGAAVARWEGGEGVGRRAALGTRSYGCVSGRLLRPAARASTLMLLGPSLQVPPLRIASLDLGDEKPLPGLLEDTLEVLRPEYALHPPPPRLPELLLGTGQGEHLRLERRTPDVGHDVDLQVVLSQHQALGAEPTARNRAVHPLAGAHDGVATAGYLAVTVLSRARARLWWYVGTVLCRLSAPAGMP